MALPNSQPGKENYGGKTTIVEGSPGKDKGARARGGSDEFQSGANNDRPISGYTLSKDYNRHRNRTTVRRGVVLNL
jgi:hypothetical protein